MSTAANVMRSSRQSAHSRRFEMWPELVPHMRHARFSGSFDRLRARLTRKPYTPLPVGGASVYKLDLWPYVK